MKILTIHADFIEFEAKKKALKQAEKVDKGPHKVDECLVVFTAVEKRDESNIKEILKKYISEIKNIAKQVKAEKNLLAAYEKVVQGRGGHYMKVLSDRGFKVLGPTKH